MLCLRCSRGLSAVSSLSITSRVAQSVVLKPSSTRTFTSLAPLRPTLSSSFRPSLATSTPQPCLPATTTGEGVLDLLPKASAHPALAGIQVRCGPRNTFNPSHFVRKRRHGFLSRIRTRKGRMTLQRRRAKRRSTLSH